MLENAGYIERKKAIVKGRVRTVVKITEEDAVLTLTR